MATPFLSSEEYDERAHRLYNDGDYDRALEVLKEGLVLYPQSVELHVGLGYTRLAREEYVWAKNAFENALALEPDHEDALVGAGEVYLRFGWYDEALEAFDRVRRGAAGDDVEFLLSMGRALYREQLFHDALEIFEEAVDLDPSNAEAVAARAYALHRTGEEEAARDELYRALNLEPDLYEARIYLGHLLYDHGDRHGAVEQFEQVPPTEHWDTLAIWRILELKKTASGGYPDRSAIAVWEARLEELAALSDPIDELLADIERTASEVDGGADSIHTEPLAGDSVVHRVRTPDGKVFAGDWLEIVQQLRDIWGQPDETVAQFMRRRAAQQYAQTGVGIPSDDPEAFLRACARAGFLRIEC